MCSSFFVGDHVGEMRAYGNLGMAFAAAQESAEALNHYRHQLMIALKVNFERPHFENLSL